MKRIALFISIVISIIACEDITEIEDISDKTVTILAPTNNAILDTLITTFTWEAIEDADNYYVQVATPNFEQATQIVIDTLLANTSYSKLLPANSYEWRVRAENSGYKTGYTQQHFSIEN